MGRLEDLAGLRLLQKGVEPLGPANGRVTRWSPCQQSLVFLWAAWGSGVAWAHRPLIASLDHRGIPLERLPVLDVDLCSRGDGHGLPRPPPDILVGTPCVPWGVSLN